VYSVSNRVFIRKSRIWFRLVADTLCTHKVVKGVQRVSVKDCMC